MSSSQRATRSSAPRLPLAPPQQNDLPQSPLVPSNSTSTSTKRKRKAQDNSPPQPQPRPAQSQTPPRRRKRSRVEPLPNPPPQNTLSTPSRKRGSHNPLVVMSGAGPSKEHSEAIPAQGQPAPSQSSWERKQKSKRQASGDETPSSSSRHRKADKEDEDVVMHDDDDDDDEEEGEEGDEDQPDSENKDTAEDSGGEPSYRLEDEDDEDEQGDNPFSGGFLGRHGGPLGMSSTLRALTGMMSGVSGRLRGILENLKQKDDPSVQLIALQELSEILLVSNEDNLHGHFHPEAFVKELVPLMQPNEFTGEANEEMMLAACRCLANLMEALPVATASVVYGGSVPVLCQNIRPTGYIDVAEQALSTLEKISIEFPGSIVKEGGLDGCLTFLDFFPTSTQRTAVTTAANCCRNIPQESFPVVRDVMPTVLQVLGSSDQKVLEQGCLCVSRIVESFRDQDTKLEELVSAEMLRAILGLLLPGTTNLIGPNIHTQFLRVISTIARASPKRSVELIQMNVVDTLYQILTGVSPPSGSEDIANKIDSVVIMQALIHRPREQIFETLNVICELLPNVQGDGLMFLDDLFDTSYPGSSYPLLPIPSRKASNEKKVELLKDCREEVKRFATILLPTLTDAYSSTVNLNVRQKVLNAQLKMLSNLDGGILEDALRAVPYASYLASILSQQDHPTLMTYALQAAELLLKRLEPIYRYQFYREGVIAEISKLASRPCKPLDEKLSQSKEPKSASLESNLRHSRSPSSTSSSEGAETEHDEDEGHDEDDHSDEEDPEDHDESGENPDHEDTETDSLSSGDDRNHQYVPERELPNMDDLITMQAKQFLERHVQSSSKAPNQKAADTLEELKSLAQEIRRYYLDERNVSHGDHFQRLAEYFDGDALESITSYELLTSDVVQVLLEVFGDEQGDSSAAARSAFLEAFMGPGTQTKQRTLTSSSPATPFSVLVNKLQDLLSRAEHFEVITVHSNTFDSNRGSGASMLAKQLRLKLSADEGSGIPVAYRSIMVSIQAIATFKSLDDYLRPRLVLAERPRGGSSRSRETMMNAMAAYAATFGGRDADGRRLPIPPPFATAPGEMSRETHKPASRSKSATRSSGPPQQDNATMAKPKQETIRKSRRKPEKKDAVLPPPPPPAEESTEDQLECADETRLSDEEGSLGSSTLDAIVDDLEEEMAEDVPDPDAVNMEIASTGKVTARKEDGTRVATPLGGAQAPKPGSSSKPPESARSVGTPTMSASRAMSYAAAIQAIPQDWHLEFFVNDEPVSSDSTIYRAIHFNPSQEGEVSSRNLWQAVHTIKYKRVKGPPPRPTLSPSPENRSNSHMPASLHKNPTTTTIVRLLSLLHELNANIDDVMSNDVSTVKLHAEPLSQFVNTKLTAKMNRQLEEPLIVASHCLPSWSEDLARLYPFLFPFETRHLFLQSTSFGYSRSMTRWQNSQEEPNHHARHRHRDERPFLGRLQRQKVRISRTRILESAVKVMELYGSSPSILEVEYFEEVGTGLGPTLEFYSTVSKEFSKKKLKLWRENDSNDLTEYAFGKCGLFPAPMSPEQATSDNGKKVLTLFKVLGKFVARSMLDSRIIDVNFNSTFFRVANADSSGVAPSLGAVSSVDKDLVNSLRVVKRFASAKKSIDENSKLTPAQKVRAIQQIEIDGVKVEDLALDFTLPGYPAIELAPGGSGISVTIDNVNEYVNAVLDMTLDKGVKRQIESFKEGFSLVFPYTALRAFTPEELVMLFGRVEEDWSLETLMDSIKADHGFNLDSRSVRNLLTVMSELNAQSRRDFLQFITGSPKLPIGGFKALTPMFTVVCKPSEAPYTSDDYLPSVMTCVNYLKLPDYSSLDVMRAKLGIAIAEGQGAFHLS